MHHRIKGCTIAFRQSSDQILTYTCYETLTGIDDSANASLNGKKLPTPLVSALSSAAPVYARTYWLEDNASNERWIAAAKLMLGRFGGVEVV